MGQLFSLQRATNNRIIVIEVKNNDPIGLLIPAFPGEISSVFARDHGPTYTRDQFVNIQQFPEIKNSDYFAFEYLSEAEWKNIVPVSFGLGECPEQEINNSPTNNCQYWLMKSEPRVYGISDLQGDKQTIWDGVRNYQARNFLREMKEGDLAFFYHSNTLEPGIVGLMQIVESNLVDPSQFDRNSEYYDPKSDLKLPKWQTVRVEFLQVFPNTIRLKSLREKFSGEELMIVRKCNRLSVIPVEEKVAQKILSMVDNPIRIKGFSRLGLS
jgi:predicted RNA-binding protein with PUA-like domain